MNALNFIEYLMLKAGFSAALSKTNFIRIRRLNARKNLLSLRSIGNPKDPGFPRPV